MAFFHHYSLPKREILHTNSWSILKRYYEVYSSTKTKRYAPNPDKIAFIKRRQKKIVKKPVILEGPRKNELGIQMLSKPIYEKIFAKHSSDTTNNNKELNIDLLEQCRTELFKHNIKLEDNEILPEVDFKLPPLKGANIEEHFFNIGNEQVKVYKELVLELLKNIPKPPSEWKMQEGWTRYEQGEIPQKVDYPLEEALVFDVEVCVPFGKTPTLATCVSNKAWYGWVSSSLIEGTHIKPTTHHQYQINSLIPLESSAKDNGQVLTSQQRKEKIIIGHNVSYDRARIKEQYWLNKTGTRFIDTMSLHICVSGLTSYQRAVLKSTKFLDEDAEIWKEISSLNNLVDVYKLYCNKTISKQTRNIFVDGNLADIKENFQEVMSYCCGDVKATYEIMQVLFPMFLERFSHPVTLAGMLELSTAYLPLNNNWNRYVSDSEQAFEDLENESKILLARRADEACQLMHNEQYKNDLWFWNEDWDSKNIKMKKVTTKKKSDAIIEAKKKLLKNEDDEEIDELEQKFKELFQTQSLLPKVRTVLPGYPNWYRKLCSKSSSTVDWIPGPQLLSTSMKITPKLLSLTWEGYPLYHMKDKGWGFLVPKSTDIDHNCRLPLNALLKKCPLLTDKPNQVNADDSVEDVKKRVDDNLMRKEFYSRLKKDKTDGLYKGTGVWCGIEIEDCCWFFKLPHKDGPTNNVGNPLARDFLNKFSENVLAGDSHNAEEVLSIARKLSYWRNNRKRILDQMVVWLDAENLPQEFQELGINIGAIIPQVVVSGTLTRRAVEATWMTASNAHRERIGSELKSLIQAPPNYNIIGADVDSQELWIASILGDAYSGKMHGCTPLGWMTLSGTKSKKTDMHSITAQAVGISRDHAKVINYARIYGAGQQFAERLLNQFNPLMSEAEARQKARKMFNLTKGRKTYCLKPEFLSDYGDQLFGKWQAFELAKSCGKTVAEMFQESKWIGGTESAMFNRLEEIANSAKPRTPFLGCRLTRSLENSEDRFLTTRVNWVVQSGAVDFLHLLLTCMKWLMDDKMRFCISFHDEVRYLVPEQFKYQAALALHVANLLTRSFCASKLGIHDLPQSVAFFSSVEVDTVVRKECEDECETPSNPHGMEKGYSIKKGEALDIFRAIEKAKGRESSWYEESVLKN